MAVIQDLVLIFCPTVHSVQQKKLKLLMRIGLLQLAITWYKIRHAGGHGDYYSRTGTLKQRDLNQ